MKRTSLVLILLICSTAFVWAQGFETFDNLGITGSSYQDGTFLGQDGSTWTFWRCRGDYEITGKAIMIGRNLDPQSEVYSGTISGGIGVLNFDYMQAFGTNVDLNVEINGDVVAHLASSGQQGVVLNSGDVDVNVAGDFVIRFINRINGGGQVVIDNVAWTGYVPPSISNITQSPLYVTSEDEVNVSADITQGDADIDFVELRWGTESGVYDFAIPMVQPLRTDEYGTWPGIPEQTDGTTIYYVVYAEDVNNLSATSPEQSYTVWDPKTTTLPYEETFDNDLGDCYVYSVKGDNHYWVWNDFQENGFAHMSGYQSGELQDDWLILPGIDMSQYEEVTLTFDTEYRYHTPDTEHHFFKLLYSTDYPGIGNPLDYTWTELSFVRPNDDAWGWINSGDVALNDTEDTLWLAFRYYYDDDHPTWRVDNIHVSEPPTTELPFTTNYTVVDNWNLITAAGTYGEKEYLQGGWYFHSTHAVRGSLEDELFGDSDYAFRERGIFTVYNMAALEGMTGFSFQLLDWMTGDGADRDLNITIDGGDSWTTILTVNKDWFADYQTYQPFIYYFSEAKDFAAEEFQIEILNSNINHNNSRINIGQFKAFDTYPEILPAGTEITVGDVTINVSHGGDDPISYNPNPADPPEMPGDYTSQLLFSVTGTPGEPVTFTFGPTNIPVGYWYNYSAEEWDGPHNNVEEFITMAISFNSDIFITLGDPIGDPLPVELSSFTASIIANRFVQLQWVSETETNMLGYNIYRNRVNFVGDAVKVNSELIPATNSSEQQTYVFVDEEVMIGETYYYWLQSNEFDLSYHFHGPVSILVGGGEEGDTPSLPLKTELVGAFPNPFNPDTRIAFSLEERSQVTISVYNMVGQLIRTVVSNQEYNKGSHLVLWDGMDSLGRQVGSGIYFYRMESDCGYTMIKKMALIK